MQQFFLLNTLITNVTITAGSIIVLDKRITYNVKLQKSEKNIAYSIISDFLDIILIN